MEANMHYRQLGRTGLIISEISIDASDGWKKLDETEINAALDRAFALGVNFIHLPPGSGESASGMFINAALSRQREKIVIAARISPRSGGTVQLHQPVTETFPMEWVIESTERTLSNLNIETIDLQQLDGWNTNYLSQLDWYEGLIRLKEQGKIRSFGIIANDWDACELVNVIQSGLIDTVQVIYNLFEQRPAEELFPSALGNNVGVIVREPLEAGLLTGKLSPNHAFDEDDPRAIWLTGERLQEVQNRLEAIKPFINDDRPEWSSLALKFALSHPAVSTVAVKMHLANEVEDFTHSSSALLTLDEVDRLREYAFVHGWRMHE
jgi:aryl-alcohol dehydrogenase-like predicted oxidoreductase